MLAAEGAAGVQVLRLLVARGHEVAVVLTGAGAAPAGATVAGLARELKLPLAPAELVGDPAFADQLQDVDLLLNVHSLHIATTAVIEAPRRGSFNLHPGPLPECAGLHAPSWAIFEGRQRHGVTLHRMAPEIDAGPIAFCADFPIAPTDTGLTVTMGCVRAGVPLVERLLACAERGEPIPALAQDPTRRRWFGPGPPDGGRLHWERPARGVVDLIRACDYRPLRSPWPPPATRLGATEIGVLSARYQDRATESATPGTIGERHGQAVDVAALDRWVCVERVCLADRELAAAEVLSPGQHLSY